MRVPDAGIGPVDDRGPVAVHQHVAGVEVTVTHHRTGYLEPRLEALHSFETSREAWVRDAFEYEPHQRQSTLQNRPLGPASRPLRHRDSVQTRVQGTELSGETANSPRSRGHDRGHRVASRSVHDLNGRRADLARDEELDDLRGRVAVFRAPLLQTSLTLDERKPLWCRRHPSHDRQPLWREARTREAQRVDPEVVTTADPCWRLRFRHFAAEPTRQPLANPTRQVLRGRSDAHDDDTLDTQPHGASCAVPDFLRGGLEISPKDTATNLLKSRQQRLWLAASKIACVRGPSFGCSSPSIQMLRLVDMKSPP